MVVGLVARTALWSQGWNDLSRDVNRFHCGFDEPGSSKRGADGLRAMPQFQAACTGLEQERCEHEEVLAAHESNLDVRAQGSFEVACGRHAAEPAAQHHDACCHLGHGLNLEWYSASHG